MVAELGSTQLGQGTIGQAHICPGAVGVPDQAGLAQQLVALDHLFLVPGGTVAAKAKAQALGPAGMLADAGRLGGRPGIERRLDLLLEAGRATVAPILPGEIVIPAAPGDAAALVDLLGSDQRQIADAEDDGGNRTIAAVARQTGLELRQTRQIAGASTRASGDGPVRSEEHTSELQSLRHLV